MGHFWDDLRIALRSLKKARGFAAAVVATLALAIALATSVLAVVNAYLIRALPYPGASRLYGVSYSRPGEAAPRGLADLSWDALSDVVEHPISWDLDMFYLVGGDHPDAAPGAWVTPGFMQGLGIRPAVGRGFAPDEFKPGGPQVALLSHGLWQRRFGGDSGVIGRQFGAYVSDRPSDPDLFTIVGILPANFWHLNPYTEILTPLRAPSYPYLVSLREGISPAVAEQRITDLVRQGQGRPATQPSVELRSVHAQYTRTIRPILLAIGAAVGLVLLIAGANVAFLALIRGTRRQREVAVRLALGAGRTQVARMLLAEALLLAGTAALVGTGLARVLLRLLAPGVQLQLGRPIPGGPAALSIDGTVAAATVGLTLLLGAALTLAPLLASRHSLFSMLRRGKSGTEGSHGRRTRAALIAVEVAGSLSLLVACGLMVRTVVGLLQVDLGIQPARVLTATLGLRERSYPDAEPRITFYERLLGELGQTSGVTGAALSAPSPLSEFEPTPIQAEDPGSPASSVAGIRWITPGYFTVLAIPVSQGRDFSNQDRAGSEPVAILSQSAARRLWPGKPALGKRLRVVERQITRWDTVTVTRTVVGVVRDVRHSPTDSVPAEVYVPLLQAPGRFAAIVLVPRGRRPAGSPESAKCCGGSIRKSPRGSYNRFRRSSMSNWPGPVFSRRCSPASVASPRFWH